MTETRLENVYIFCSENEKFNDSHQHPREQTYFHMYHGKDSSLSLSWYYCKRANGLFLVNDIKVPDNEVLKFSNEATGH